jgi:hypothetical protein
VIWVLPSGERRHGRIAICAPEPDPHPDVEEDATWAFWWFLEGLWSKPRPALGSGSLQPLILALKMIGYELHALIASGGQVLIPGEKGAGSAPALLSLRVLMRKPGEPPPADPALADLDAEIANIADDEEG